MLVLARKKNEEIMIGDDIMITVIETRGDKCRLGISAPKEIPVHRREIYEQIQKQTQAAMQQVTNPNSEFETDMLADMIEQAEKKSGPLTKFREEREKPNAG